MKYRILWLLSLLVCGTGLLRAQVPSQTDEPPFMDYRTPRRYIIKDIQVEGAQQLEPELLISYTGMARGDSVYLPGSYLTDAVKNLWRMRRFADVRTEVETEGDSAVIFLYLTHRPIVNRIAFEGLRKSEGTELLEKIEVRPNYELSDIRISNSILSIKRYLENKSFLNAEVTLLTQDDTARQNVVNVTFRVDKGPRVKIGRIDFEGNNVFTDRRLRRTMKTHQKSINIFASSRFSQEKFDEDKFSLIEFYNSKGYRNARILADSIYPIRDNRVGIDLQLEEGDLFYYRNITWMGNSVYNTEMLNRILAIQPGDVYDRKTMDKMLGIRTGVDPMYESVASLYQNNGYLRSNIEAQEIVVAADSIDLLIKIIEGKQATLNEITIAGNNRVYDHVIRRDLDVRPGELYSRAMLMQTMTRLSQMVHFSQESTIPALNPVGDDRLDLAYNLVETPSDELNVSGGWGAGMFVGSIGMTLKNFSARNFFKKGAWRPYPAGDNQQLSIQGQSNGMYYKALSLSFVEPWLGGKKPNGLRVSLYYSDQTDAMYAWQAGDKHFRTLGASAGVSRRLRWPDNWFTLYNEISYQAYNLKDWTDYGFIISNGTSNIVSLRTELARSTSNDYYFPSAGSDISLSLALTPPYSLFDGLDYSDPNLSDNDRYRWVEYHKWLFKADWYFPLSTNNKLVLRTNVQMGFQGSYNSNKPSPFEGFQMGGDGMTGYSIYGVDIVSLRGYENGALTPNSAQSKAYVKYSTEMRYKVLQQGQTMIYGLVFAEAGNAFSRVRDFDPFLLKRSAGVGVRIMLPVVGWLGIDYGYGFDRDINGKKGGGNPHFIIGQQF